MKLEPTSEETKAMSANDIFLSRLKLLIIMAKAYFKNYPIGKYRKTAIIENAHHVFLSLPEIGLFRNSVGYYFRS